MDCSSWDELALRIESHRAGVQEAFNALFEMEPQREQSAKLVSWLMDPQAAPDPDGLAGDLMEAGIVDAKPVARRLIEFTRSARYRKLSSVVRTKCEKLLPKVVAAIAAEDGAEGTAARLLSLLEAIDGREAYYSLLLEFPQVLKRAVHLAARSVWAARLLARHPILLDELTRSAASFTATDWAMECATLRAECAQLAPDLERLLDHLRHFKQRHMLRLTIADIEDELAVMALSDELSALADTVLLVTVEEASANLGMPRGGVPGFIVVGYGKLGGKELGYGSDLDIIFLYDETNSPPAEKLARLAQRVSSWLTSHTAAGVLYETDLRLRPDGASGLLVSSIAAFKDYQEKRAWTWEHQALTRARFAAGDVTLGARFESLRDELLAQPRDREKLFADIVAMRKKMRGENRNSTDIKHVAGGVIDLEFSVQALVLAHGPQHPMLRENKGNHTLLKRMGSLGLIDAEIATEAAEAYLAMRQRIHRAALNDEEIVRLAADEMQEERLAVMRLRKAVFQGELT
jgi:glutamate-ammonia-ligase adenylyltransferase